MINHATQRYNLRKHLKSYQIIKDEIENFPDTPIKRYKV